MKNFIYVLILSSGIYASDVIKDFDGNPLTINGKPVTLMRFGHVSRSERGHSDSALPVNDQIHRQHSDFDEASVIQRITQLETNVDFLKQIASFNLQAFCKSIVKR